MMMMRDDKFVLSCLTSIFDKRQNAIKNIPLFLQKGTCPNITDDLRISNNKMIRISIVLLLLLLNMLMLLLLLLLFLFIHILFQ